MSDEPPIADGIHHQLDPRVISLHRLIGLIVCVIVAVAALWGLLGATLAALVNDGPAAWVFLLGAPIWFAVTGLLAWHARRWPEISYRHASYRVDDTAIEIRRGVFWRNVINVPRSRVQHLDVSQGPFERRYGLGTLIIHTAGTDHAQVQLGGLDHARALRIREHLLPTGRTSSDAV